MFDNVDLTQDSKEVIDVELPESLIIKAQEFCDIEDIALDEFVTRALLYYLEKNFDYWFFILK